MFYVILMLAGLAGGDPGLGSSEATYEELKVGGAARRLERLDAEAALWLDAALDRRGHSGDRTVLMGCDLTDPKADQERRALKRLMRSSDDTDFEQAEAQVERLRRAVSPSGADPEPQGDEDWLVWAAARDQQARRALGDAAPEGFEALADEATTLRLEAMCAEDFARSPRLARILDRWAELTPVARGAAFILLMHQDHDPGLQAKGAAAFRSLGLDTDVNRQAFSRLADRAALNRGEPQLYGRLYQCATEPPALDGAVLSLEELERNRKIIGLEPFELEFSRMCGRQPSGVQAGSGRR